MFSNKSESCTSINSKKVKESDITISRNPSVSSYSSSGITKRIGPEEISLHDIDMEENMKAKKLVENDDQYSNYNHPKTVDCIVDFDGIQCTTTILSNERYASPRPARQWFRQPDFVTLPTSTSQDENGTFSINKVKKSKQFIKDIDTSTIIMHILNFS